MVLYLGAAGLGKTSAITGYPDKGYGQYPDPLIIDGESGTRHSQALFDGAVLHTKSLGELLRALRQFKSAGKVTWKEGDQTIEYIPKTIAVDPGSAFWESMQVAKFADAMQSQGLRVETGAEKPKADGDTFAAWMALTSHWKAMLAEGKSCGINFVMTAHEKEESKSAKDERGKMKLEKTGRMIAELQKSYEYDFDLVLRLVMDGEKRVAVVMKSRLKTAEGKDRFQMGQKLSRWDYDFLSNGLSENVQTEAVQAPADDKALLDKDPAALKLAHEIRSSLAPKAGISSEDLDIYVCAKVMADGVTPFAVRGEDGKVHLSTVPLDRLTWLKSVLEGEKSRLKLAERVEELKKGVK